MVGSSLLSTLPIFVAVKLPSVFAFASTLTRVLTPGKVLLKSPRSVWALVLTDRLEPLGMLTTMLPLLLLVILPINWRLPGSLTLGVSLFVSGVMPSLASGVTLVDRKSTRLNSSHANISYAVFCL